MSCGHCGTQLVPGKAYCPGCGRPAGRPCERCGAVVAEGFRFCPDCGAPAEGGRAASRVPAQEPPRDPRYGQSADDAPRWAPPSPSGLGETAPAVAGGGERKLVTVLFCDLAGSTAIAEGMDPEAYRELLDRYLEITIEEIYRVGGIVNQLAGDGLMALFGAPVAHEDDAERAVRAGLGIRDALAALNERQAAAGAPVLQARIGIHTGPLVVGTVGTALKMDYTATGDTTNTAARLESLARPGSVLVSGATWRLLRGRFEVRPLGELTVRGRGEPIEAYEVLRAARPGETPHGEKPLTPLYGREPELRQLEACLERAAEGLPQVVEIVGPMGSGKSRLLYEFLARIGNRATVLQARCESLTRMVPYAPWIGMLRGFFGLDPDAGALVARRKIRERLAGWEELDDRFLALLCRMLGYRESEGLELSTDALEQQIFDAVSSMFHWLCSRAPVVEVIEDIHWIDEGSRKMLEAAAAQFRDERAMTIVTHRPGFSLPWRTRAVITRVELRPLERTAMRAILRAQVGGELPEDLEERILARAEGSPYFVEEIVRSLLDEGAIEATAEGPRLTRRVEDLRIPDTIQEVIESRLDHLGPRTKRVLQVASVLGRQFRRDELAELLAGEDIDVDRELAGLLAAGVLHRKESLRDDELRFGESLTQEIAYETLLIRERRQLHARAARLLEKDTLRLPGAGARLAHHLARSDNPTGAVRVLLEAARQAEQVPSFVAAAELYGEAWRVAERSWPLETQRERSEAAVEAALGYLRMCVIYGAARESEAERIAERALQLATELGDPEAAAAMHSLQGMLMFAGGDEDLARGLEIVAAGMRMAAGAGLERTAASLGRGLAWGYLLDGRFTEAREQIERAVRALEPARGESPMDEYFGARFVRDKVFFYSEQLDAALASATETYRLAVEHRNRTVQGSAGALLAETHLLRGNFGEACRLAREALEVTRSIGNMAATRAAAAVLARAPAAAGREPVPGQDLLALLLSGREGAPSAPAEGLQFREQSLRLVEALLVLREPGLAETGAREALRLGGRLRRMLASAALGKALSGRRPGRPEEARAAFREAEKLAEEIDSRLGTVVARLGLAGVALQEGDAEDAASLAESALAMAERIGAEYYAARAREVLERTAPAAVPAAG